MPFKFSTPLLSFLDLLFSQANIFYPLGYFHINLLLKVYIKCTNYNNKHLIAINSLYIFLNAHTILNKNFHHVIVLDI